MLAKDLISEIVPALKTSDTGADALNWMEVFRVSHLPIVNNKVFLGLISDADIYDLNAVDEPLGNHKLSLIVPYVFEHQHIYEVIEIAARLKLTIVPVLSEEQEYMGVITQNDLLIRFSELIAAQTPGGIIEIEVGPRDYALSEISRIVEDSNAKILSLYVSQKQGDEQLKITIKLNRVDISSVENAFVRYGYNIRSTYVGEPRVDDTTRRNFESLMKYLSI
ncbi:CBS domain-containing protein [Thermophagus sp. OGC60D27]|uniref:CBS domain-containing protein n=1 Tax=Thermophagus sp. OGC60D27 TaxID=3458415 RepID=UPI004038168E